MRWLVDTSALARRSVPDVARQIRDILQEDDSHELVLSPSVLLEMMRGAQREAVAEERERLCEAMEVLTADAGTFELAADAMQHLALHRAEAHRLPIADLVTAALAHQYGCGVIHIDDDFALLEAHSGLTFTAHELELPAQGVGDAGPAPRQRALKKELAQLLHQMPVADAEAFLEDVLEQARRRLAS